MISTLQAGGVEQSDRARAAGIAITALHSHMLDDVPRLFMHFWANDDALKRATRVAETFDRTNVRR